MENLNAEKIVIEIQSIIKALKANKGWWEHRGKGGWFNHDILVDAVAVINSQEQRIKELTEENERVTQLLHKECENNRKICEMLDNKAEECKKLTEENERLKAENEALAVSEVKECEISQMLVYRIRDKHPAVMAVIADTVRKMQERLKAKAYTNNYCQEVVLVSDIDQIANEIVETK